MKLKDDQITKRLIRSDLVKALIIEGLNDAAVCGYNKPHDIALAVQVKLSTEFQLHFKDYGKHSRLTAAQQLLDQTADFHRAKAWKPAKAQN